jgi:molecular chaperone DnaK
VASTMIHIPVLDVDVPLGREQLERLARPILDRTVTATRTVLADAEVPAGGLAATFLAGGSSRMPLIGTVLHHAFSLAPTRINQPELVVAEGSLRAAAGTSAQPETAAASVAAGRPDAIPAEPRRADARTEPDVRTGADVQTGTGANWPEPEPVHVPAGIGRSIDRRLRTGLLAAAVVAVLALAVAAVRALPGAEDRGRGGGGPARGDTPASTRAADATGSAAPSTRAGIDPCLLGTWQVTSNRAYGLLDNVRVQYEGGAGILVTYRADGTAFVDYSAMQPRFARHRGAVWADVHRGTATFRYYAQNGEITDSLISSDAVDTLTRNGKVNATAPVQYFLETTKYICTEDRLTTTGSQGNFSSEAVRVRPSTPPRPDSRAQ